MAHLYRLIALFLLGCSFNVSAAVPPTNTPTPGFSEWYSAQFQRCIDGPWQPSPGPCNLASNGSTHQLVAAPPRMSGSTQCSGQFGMCVWSSFGGTVPICPANSKLGADGLCHCNEGFKEQGSQCVPNIPEEEQFCETQAWIWNSTLNPDRYIERPGRNLNNGERQTVCLDLQGHPKGDGYGCKMAFTPEMAWQSHDGAWRTSGIAWAYIQSEMQNGEKLSCAGDRNAPADSAGQTLPEANPTDPKCNGSKGTVNGVEVCIPATAGNHEGVDWNRVTGSDGTATDVRTRVECNRDTCKVTEDRITRDPSGNSTGTSTIVTENVPRESYCARNPTAKVCTTDRDRSGVNRPGPSQGSSGSGSGGNGDGDGDSESSFGGSCGGGFQCEGDAIQCAMAREQHKRACELFVNTNPESTLFNNEKGKEGNQTENLPGNETINLANRISSVDALGVAPAGLQDLQLTVWGQSVALPLSNLNPYLAILGNVLVAVSFLIAARIIGRG